MPQDFNTNSSTCSSLIIFIYWAYERQGSQFLPERLG